MCDKCKNYGNVAFCHCGDCIHCNPYASQDWFDSAEEDTDGKENSKASMQEL